MDLFEDVVLRNGSTATLRARQPDDEPSLRPLVPEAFTRPTPSDIVLVADVGGHVAAAVVARPDGRGSTAAITIAVDGRHQGLGLGTLLFEAAADVARRAGLTHFTAHVPASNARMRELVTQSGFALTTTDAGKSLVVRVTLAPTRNVEGRHHERARVAASASMRAFFEPSGVVVIGANRARGKIGSEILHNIIAGGYSGPLFVVHPSADRIDDVRAYPAVGAIPGDVDLAIIAVPAAQVPDTVDACIAKGVRAVVVISAGFGETGLEGRILEDRLVERIREAGVRMVGPNCMGIFNAHPSVQLHATFSPVAPLPGRVAMSTQSGALGLAILDYARRLNIGFSTFVSVGNKADVSSNDLIQYWANDPHTDVILLYVESFGNPKTFSQIARRVSRVKPIVAVKSGRSAAGARAASSHTGALASSDAIVEALFRQSGVIRTRTIEELFDVATVLTNQPLPAGRRVAILTNAGGPGILAADACQAEGLELPLLSDTTVAALRSFLPAAAAVANPVDILASASAADFGRALSVVLNDEQVDSVIVIFIPPMVTKGDDVASAVQAAAVKQLGKPVAAVFISADPAPPMLAPIPSFTFPEAAATAFAHVARYREWRDAPHGRVVAFPDIDDAAVRRIVAGRLAQGGGWATADEASAILDAVGVPRARAATVTTIEAALERADALGYPVVLKALGPTLVHKTEAKAIRINLRTADELREAWRDLTTRLGSAMTGGLVQELVTGGVEMLVGMVEDATFGPVVACAIGGIFTEVLGDSQFRLQPLTDRDATSMVAELRAAKLLSGYRGARPSDVGALEATLLRISALVDLAPEIRELDLNPLVVLPSGVVALDARVRIGRPAARPRSRRVEY